MALQCSSTLPTSALAIPSDDLIEYAAVVLAEQDSRHTRKARQTPE